MRIEGNTVIFRSYPSMYEVEESGVKPNTVRILDFCETSQVIENWDKLTHIRIEEVGHDRSFTRELTDITELGELLGKDVFVFSWRHEEYFNGEIEYTTIYNKSLSNDDMQRLKKCAKIPPQDISELISELIASLPQDRWYAIFCDSEGDFVITNQKNKDIALDIFCELKNKRGD